MWPIHVIFLATAAGFSLPAQPASARFVSYGAGTVALDADALEALGRQGDRVVPLDDPQGAFAEDMAANLEPARLAQSGAAEWVHVATKFPELVAARRAGATTVWLDPQAASNAGDIETQGYFATAIIDDFADAIVGAPAEVPGVLDEARVARARREAKDARDEEEEAQQLIANPLSVLERQALDVDVAPAAAAAAAVPPAPMVAPPTTPSSPAAAVEAALTKFCMECGQELPMRAKFCKRCGEPQE